MKRAALVLSVITLAPGFPTVPYGAELVRIDGRVLDVLGRDVTDGRPIARRLLDLPEGVERVSGPVRR